jgi:hypothetical protein
MTNTCSDEEYRRLTGEALIAAMQASPYRDIDIEPPGHPMPVRGVDLGRAGCSTPTWSRT